MRDTFSGFDQGDDAAPRGGFSERAGEQPGASMPPLPAAAAGQLPLPQTPLAYRLRAQGITGAPSLGTAHPSDDRDISLDSDCLTNIYYLAQYTYQISITAAPMAEHELGLLLPRTGRAWFNGKLFSSVPHARELAQRDAWWRVIDSSPAVRFLLGWCVSLYRTAQFHQIPRERLPGWSRILYFDPGLPDASRMRMQLWSDVTCDLTNLFAPSERVWKQIQEYAPLRVGDRHWEAHLIMAGQSGSDIVRFLADRNSCPRVIIQRALKGNPPITSYAEYRTFTEAVIEDLPRLQMQRQSAMRQNGEQPRIEPPAAKQPVGARLGAMLRGEWAPVMPDPRQDPSFWHLHL